MKYLKTFEKFEYEDSDSVDLTSHKRRFNESEDEIILYKKNKSEIDKIFLMEDDSEFDKAIDNLTNKIKVSILNTYLSIKDVDRKIRKDEERITYLNSQIQDQQSQMSKTSDSDRKSDISELIDKYKDELSKIQKRLSDNKKDLNLNKIRFNDYIKKNTESMNRLKKEIQQKESK